MVSKGKFPNLLMVSKEKAKNLLIVSKEILDKNLEAAYNISPGENNARRRLL
jgi:hypothetical protein